ncbi:hypothetical protein ARMGADRAFT_1168268 [Armillaria gallica]|uniref:Heterokaryon incompatibility domain-containing protein n=1 Tax=Armillaria gallica TaxID=47427 RepID=A0A2H3DKX3_ARMGA|nr:hypothetical protein ARMGADRAFT_1168268 [Armillaria gallica]
MVIADTHADINIAPPLNGIPDLIERILEAEKSKKEKRDKIRKMAVYHETSISALAEQEASIKIPFQQKYSGRKPVVTSSLASTPCVKLGIDKFLFHLNTLLGTSYKSTMPSLSSLLESCISANYDFGTAYSRLRPEWFSNFATVKDLQRKLEEEDQKIREEALVDNRIRVAMPPRRVWDLYSNRVMPCCLILEEPWAILHDGVDDLVSVTTPINGGEWPVPVPADANLDLIRIELLNLGAEYVWLDALCLRQRGGKREDLRETEWRTDMPTIGNVYRWSEVVVHYLNGLGRVSGRTNLKRRHLDVCDRSWFRCAWKEPEVNNHEIVAGYVPPDTKETVHTQGEAASSQKHLSEYTDKGLQDFQQTDEESRARGSYKLSHILADMQERVSTNPVDRIAGLAWLLSSRTLPAYYENESLEDAWTALMNSMYPSMRSSFLFLYPDAGLGHKKWRPTWTQVMTEPLPDTYCHGFVHHDDNTDEDWCEELCIEKGYILGLDTGSTEGYDRCGELVVKDKDGIAHTFRVRVTHQSPIPEDVYTLLGDAWSYYVVGRRLPGQRFEKVSVIKMDDFQEVKWLDIAVKSRNILV